MSWEEREGRQTLLAFSPVDRSLVVIEIGESGEFKGDHFNELVQRQNAVTQAGYVGMLEAGVDDGLPYGVRRFVPGEILDDYLERIGKLGLSETIDLGLAALNVILLFRGWRVSEVPDLESRGIVRMGDEQTLELKVLGARIEEMARGVVAGGESVEVEEVELVRKVCSLMHRAATRELVQRDPTGRKAPNLGDLPEELRYLMWAAYERSDRQKPMELAELRSLLTRLRDQVLARPLPESEKPVCRLETLIFEGFQLQERFGGNYEELATKPAFREFVNSAYSRRLVRRPFRYRMQLQVLPTAATVGHPDYGNALSKLTHQSTEEREATLRICDSESENGFQYVVEERLNGFSLAEVSLRRGGFDARETHSLLERIHERLRTAEQEGRVPWSLRAEDVFVEFDSHLTRQELLEESRSPVEEWPPHKVVVRLHPTFSSLVRGGLLPVPEGELGKNAGERDLAALAWQLLSFSCQDARPFDGNSYRAVPRLSPEGNAFLKNVISAKTRAADVDEVESREIFLCDFKESLEAFCFRDFAEPENIATVSSTPHATSPIELLSDPTRPALRSTRRLEEGSRRRKSRKLVRKILGHAVSLSVAAVLFGTTVSVIHPETRERVFAYVGEAMDWLLDETVEPSVVWEFPVLEDVANLQPGEEGVEEPASLELVSLEGGADLDELPVVGESVFADSEDFVPDEPERTELNFAEMAEAAESIDELLDLLEKLGGSLEEISERTLRLGVATGSMMSKLELGRRLVETSPKDAMHYLEMVADEGVLEARMLLGKLLLSGVGVPKDETLAFEHLRGAAAGGNREAMEIIGARVVRGKAVPGVGFSEGRQYLKAAAELGSGQACSLLGAMYLNGMGVEKSIDEAFSLFERSARAGDANGMLYYARCLNAGIGTESDRGRSVEWYAKAARAGNERAQQWCRDNGHAIEDPGLDPGA
ncbi:MAG: tetratricopeptide repeat protein [Verrucomicrobiota bacterium]